MTEKSDDGPRRNPGWFPEGRSGNERGRRPKPPKMSPFEVLVDKTLTVTVRGVTREMTTEEALHKRIFQDALAGKRAAVRQVLKWIRQRDAFLAERALKTRQPGKRLVSVDPDNADAALQLLGIAKPDPAARKNADRAQLLLEPWAVQTALRRRRGGQRLTERQRDVIRRSTRDPDMLRWPRGTER